MSSEGYAAIKASVYLQVNGLSNVSVESSVHRLCFKTAGLELGASFLLHKREGWPYRTKRINHVRARPFLPDGDGDVTLFSRLEMSTKITDRIYVFMYMQGA